MSYAIATRFFTGCFGWTCPVLLFSGLIALFPLWVKAQCTTDWDASGEWEFRQVGQRKPIKLQLQQQGKVLTGTGVLPDGKITRNSGMSFDGVENLHGTADGYITGDSFSLHIFWENGSTGVYNGRIMPSGKVEGKGYEKGSPKVLVVWDSVGRLKCLPPTPAKSAPPTVPKPLKATGRKPVPAKIEQPPMKVPGIVTSQIIWPFLNAPTGFVVLTWDAGADHPYAEVWSKVNGGQEQFLVELGKGQRQVPVERYKQYTYTLTDAGKTLATVSFVGQ